jgi:hypothetical protein
MKDKIDCFVAYPSYPLSLAESVEDAIENISAGQTVYIKGWKSTNVAGKFIISAICKSIEICDIFICDLTTLNHNVLFELGFAIAKKKRIIIIINPSHQQAISNYKKFKILTTIGYIAYTNSSEIEKGFYKEEPYKDLDSTIYKDVIESIVNLEKEPTLFYLKSAIETDASIKLTRRIDKLSISTITDDPKEAPIQTLSSYAKEVHRAFGVIVHFLSPTQYGHQFQNAKNSFVSGLAYGFGKNILMLAHDPFESPIDYSDILKVHSTAAECELHADTWLRKLEEEYEQQKHDIEKYRTKLRAYQELENIYIGDYIAENESEDLGDYFIPTASYNEALSAKNSIFIGRKGSGKTAILYKLQDELNADKRNHVCIIKPIAYELHGILRMLKLTLPTSEKGYLIESFWKFLIYSELAKSVYLKIKEKPAYADLNIDETKIINFCEDNSHIILQDFSIRLETIVEELFQISDIKGAKNQRAKISELLHGQIIAQLRMLLGNLLSKQNKISIIIDNLDKAWDTEAEIPTLCLLLYGLLDVSRRITLEFQKSSFKQKPANLSLIIFLRSDIFAQVKKYASEKDKLQHSRINWNDPELLLRVIEERFMTYSSAINSPDEIWKRYFCQSVNGQPVRSYICNNILPRPRDLIFLIKDAISQAVNRRHVVIEQEDIIDAQKRYSQYALDSLIAESNMVDLEQLLYEFVGSKDIVYEDEIGNAVQKCGISKYGLDELIELLCDITFLAREIKEDTFVFQYNDDEKAKLQALARKISAARPSSKKRYKINDAFHSYLEIEKGSNIIRPTDYK